jgi:thiosulfate/3-mercaptopyruvate sulfurtransferase
MRDPNALITTAQLEALLNTPNLRLYDCTTTTVPPPPGVDAPYVAVSGRPAFEQAHIPGADYLDIQAEFSDNTTPLRFMLADLATLEAAFARHGLGTNAGHKVVLYSANNMWMSTRFWWMLCSLGVDAAVLDGGFDKWRAENRPTEAGPPKGYPPATFRATPRPGLFTDRHGVLAGMQTPNTVLVNALGDELFRGSAPSRYGRPGRIPGSVQVSAATLIHPATKTFTTLEDAKAKFESQGVTPEKHVIVYCGGGISANIDLFLLHQLGYDNLTLYDASMGEWARDETLPIQTG